MYFFTQAVRNDEDEFSLIPMATILPPTGMVGKKEQSEIEKRFREPMRKLKVLQKEISSDTNTMRKRIKEHRNLFPQDTEFEANMYRNISSMVGTGLSAIKEEANMTKIIVDLEQKERKLMLDNVSAGAMVAGNTGSAKSVVAGMYMGNSPVPGMGGGYQQPTILPTALIAGNGAGVSEEVLQAFDASKSSTGEVIADVPERREIVDAGLSIQPQQHKEDPVINIDKTTAMGLNYDYSLDNLKHRNTVTEEVVKYDPLQEKYWVEQRGPDGQVIEDGRKRHIGAMGNLDITDIKDGVVRDGMNNIFKAEIASAENMPEYYKKQWEEFSN